jgi:hypothetical protein
MVGLRLRSDLGVEQLDGTASTEGLQSIDGPKIRGTSRARPRSRVAKDASEQVLCLNSGLRLLYVVRLGRAMLFFFR